MLEELELKLMMLIWTKIIAAGMTPEPKVRFDNSILARPSAEEQEAKELEEKGKKTKADPNAGAPKDPQAVVDQENAKKEAAEKKKEEAGEDKKEEKKEEKKVEENKEEKKDEKAPPKANLIYHKDIIGEPGYDYSVYDFTNKNLSI